MKENKNIAGINEVEQATERKQKVSASYTVRAFGENGKKLAELGLITDEDYKKLQVIHRHAAEKYMKQELGIS